MTQIPDPAADQLDDAVVEAWLAGGPVPPGLEPAADVLAALVQSADRLRPVPTDALAQLLTACDTETTVVDLTGQRSRRGRRAGTATALAVAVALSSVGAAAAAGGLPDSAQNAVSRVVRGLTPFSVPAGPGRDNGTAVTGPAGRTPAEPAAAPGSPVTGPGAAPAAVRAVDRDQPEGLSEGPARDSPDNATVESLGERSASGGDEGARPPAAAAAQTDSERAASSADGSNGAADAGAPGPADETATMKDAVRSDPAPTENPASATPATSGSHDGGSASSGSGGNPGSDDGGGDATPAV